MRELKHYISIVLFNIKISVQLQMEYARYMFCWLLMIPIQGFSGAFVLKAITDRVDTLNGWGFGQIAFLYGLAWMSHGFNDLLFIQARGIEGLVIRGGFDRMLLRPLPIFYQFCVMNFNLVGFIDMIPGLVILGYASKLINFLWSPLNILKLLIITFGGTLIRAAIYILTGSVAFWTKKSRIFVLLNLTLMERTTMYPMSLYQVWFRFLFTFIIPMGFISFYPVGGMLNMDPQMDFPLPLGLIIWSPVVGILLFMIAMGVFYYGLRTKYESSGT